MPGRALGYRTERQNPSRWVIGTGIRAIRLRAAQRHQGFGIVAPRPRRPAVLGLPAAHGRHRRRPHPGRHRGRTAVHQPGDERDLPDPRRRVHPLLRHPAARGGAQAQAQGPALLGCPAGAARRVRHRHGGHSRRRENHPLSPNRPGPHKAATVGYPGTLGSSALSDPYSPRATQPPPTSPPFRPPRRPGALRPDTIARLP